MKLKILVEFITIAIPLPVSLLNIKEGDLGQNAKGVEEKKKRYT